jgi:hypothetical protein
MQYAKVRNALFIETQLQGAYVWAVEFDEAHVWRADFSGAVKK